MHTTSRPRMSIGQAAQRTGLSVHALRYYEREGLLAEPVGRAAGGRRTYSEDDLEWLELCVKLRSSGMPIAAVRRYTELVRAGAGNEAERLVIMREHQERLTGQIAALAAGLEIVSFKVKLYEESIASGADDPVWTPTAG
jgi:DNA-binding transcriptional MerR regulator